jgi:head-tail adaptor
MYDPVQAVVKTPQRASTANGEPTTDEYVEFCRRHLRFMPKANKDGNREVFSQHAQQSTDIIVFRMRRDVKTEAIPPTARVEWRGQVWNITGVDQIDYALDEVQFVAERLNPPIEPGE